MCNVGAQDTRSMPNVEEQLRKLPLTILHRWSKQYAKPFRLTSHGMRMLTISHCPKMLSAICLTSPRVRSYMITNTIGNFVMRIHGSLP